MQHRPEHNNLSTSPCFLELFHDCQGRIVRRPGITSDCIILSEQNCGLNQCNALSATISLPLCNVWQQELRDFVSDGDTVDTGWKILPGGGRDATSSTATTSTLPYPYKANVVDANGLPPVRSNVNSGMDGVQAKCHYTFFVGW